MIKTRGVLTPMARDEAIVWLARHSHGLRRIVHKTHDALTEGERALISRAADSVAAAYRIISTGDPNAV